MKKCHGCDINFNISSNTCPLCQNVLEDGSYETHFPSNIRRKTTNLITKILLFSSLNFLIIFGFIEFLITKNFHISFYILLGLVTNYIILSIIFKNLQNVLRIFSRYILVVIILLLIWFWVTKGHVITNYIIPSVCLFGVIFDFIVVLVLHKNYFVKYSSQIILNINYLYFRLFNIFL